MRNISCEKSPQSVVSRYLKGIHDASRSRWELVSDALENSNNLSCITRWQCVSLLWRWWSCRLLPFEGTTRIPSSVGTRTSTTSLLLHTRVALLEWVPQPPASRAPNIFGSRGRCRSSCQCSGNQGRCNKCHMQSSRTQGQSSNLGRQNYNKGLLGEAAKLSLFGSKSSKSHHSGRRETHRLSSNIGQRHMRKSYRRCLSCLARRVA